MFRPPAYPPPHAALRAVGLIPFITSFLPIPHARAEPFRFSANNMAIVDGEPRFLIGLYAYPGDDTTLVNLTRAGFNLIQTGPQTERLDRLHELGVKGWVNLGMNLDLSENAEARKAKLLAVVNEYKTHPALLLWEGPDEPLWNAWYQAMVAIQTEFASAMPQAVAARTADTPSQRDALNARIGRCRELYDRALWAECQAERTAFWKAVGQDPPPGADMVEAEETARRRAAGLTAGFEFVRRTDPTHIIWLNHAPRNSIAALRNYNRAVDMAGCDIYPVPADHPVGHSDLPQGGLPSVGAYTRRMADAAPGKAVAMVLQGFGWADINESLRTREERCQIGIGRRPRWDETRFMAYDAIVNGANAILYWGTRYIETGGPLWNDLLRIARELDALQPALGAPTYEPAPRALADDGPASIDAVALRLMLKRVDEDFVLLAVNENAGSVAFTVRDLPAALAGRTLYRLENDETKTVRDGGFRDGIRAFGVHVYATSSRFAPSN
jgi:hypothetical protein